jgi:DNA-binding LacI/PurR family transcriptional regulator
MLKRSRNHGNQKTAPTLRTVAEVVGLAPCSVSAILNNSAAALAIPEHTKERVFEAVRQLNYRPNLAARSLRTRRSYMVALVASDLGTAQTARIVAGVEGFLRAKGYLVVASSWDRTAQAAHASQLLQRGIEGIISVGATLPKSMTLPLVFIDLPASDLPEPITVLKRERLLAMAEAAAQSLLTQIEQKTGHFTRVSLSPEPTFGVFPHGVGIAVQRVPTAERFVD